MKDAWKNLPVMGAVLGIVAVSALGFAYWSNIQDRERYLQSRNFRLLAVLASQTENLLDNRERIFREALVNTPAGDSIAHWLAGLRDAMRRPGIESDLAQGVPAIEPSTGSPARIVQRLSGYRSSVSGEGPALHLRWTHRGEALPTISMKIQARTALRDIFEQKLNQGAFDTLLLADPNGHVVYATGRRTVEMTTTSVAALLRDTGADAVELSRLADTISEKKVQIAGVEYRMFTQPCCRGEDADVAVGPSSSGFIVAGLVEAEAIRIASLAISPVLVLGGAAFVMVALVGWAFFKCALIGAQQRLMRRDVFNLGASSIFGLALGTILLLTTAAYARLSADVDTQLERLASQLHRRFSEEVMGAASQVTRLTETLRDTRCVAAVPVTPRTADTPPVDPCERVTREWPTREKVPDFGYRQFTAFAMLDRSGFQRVKVAFSDATRRRVEVSERGYFQQALSAKSLWKLDQCAGGCFLESHWSWNTGQPQVVLSTRTGIPGLPVAALSIPMRPLLEPVLPPGFEFAVVDTTGQVHFHSDPQRNVHENLLVETDKNPRLQSLIGAHGAGTVNTSYWGRPYRAFVRPTVIPGWSIVALHDKQHTRGLVLEWFAVAMLMQGAYMLVWVLGMLLVLWVGGSWLWPDPVRRPWYRPLAMLYLGALVLWLGVARQAPIGTTVTMGVLLPLVLWTITYVVLRRRPAGVGHAKAWAELCRDYREVGAVLLVVSSAVPAASFFALSYDLHLAAYVKNRQIALAHAVDVRSRPCTAGNLQAVDSGRYDYVFYDSWVTCRHGSLIDGEESHSSGLIHSIIEDHLPYYTSASIALRQLMHPKADDGTWVSTRTGRGELAVLVQAGEPRRQLGVSSPVPVLVGGWGLADGSRLVWVALGALVLLLGGLVAGAYGIVSYLLRRVVLVDVVEPVRPNGEVVTAVGQHVLLLCDDPKTKVATLQYVHVLELMPIVTAGNVGRAWSKARAEVGEVAPVKRIAIPDLDDQADDTSLMRRKMGFIEELMGEPEQTVILLSKERRSVVMSWVRDVSKWPGDAERWPKLIGRLSVIDARTCTCPTAAPPERRAATEETPRGASPLNWLTALFARWKQAQSGSGWREELMATEGRPNETLARICLELQTTSAFKSGSLTRDQILEEIEERAAPLYRREWLGCDDDERVVLEHVARHGLASAASRRVVRRLLGRGLLRKDPELRLMNQSFRRFVLEGERRHEVAVLERQAEPSLWDRLHTPLALAALIAAVFLAATQREAFDATLTMAAGVTTAVPTLVKLTHLLTQLGSKPGGEPRAHA